MSKNSQMFHGEWWVPASADYDTQMTLLEPKVMMGHERKYTGTLMYHGDEDSILELYHVPSDFHSKHYCNNDVIWGIDANGNIFTLFNVVMKDIYIGDFTKSIFVVGLILLGEHVLSIEDTRFKYCTVQFTYLRNWAFHNNVTGSNAGTTVCYKSPIYAELLLETNPDDSVCWRLWQGHTIERTIHDLTITQTTDFEIEAIKALSIQSYLKQIEEFSQFLSIALYCDQNPKEIVFKKSADGHDGVLLVKMDKSVNPGVFSLIKYGILKDKIPSMLNTWHENFEKMAPISSYLIGSLQKKNRFDVPDFLIIAQALDGYHKRFVNKKNGKDVRQYEQQITILLKKFKNVEAVKACHIDPAVLKDSRHKYSHLYPDEEESKAVKGGDLYWLTEKCKILLTSCILNMLGLSNEEINLCFEKSPISQIVDSLPMEPEID